MYDYKPLLTFDELPITLEPTRGYYWSLAISGSIVLLIQAMILSIKPLNINDFLFVVILLIPYLFFMLMFTLVALFAFFCLIPPTGRLEISKDGISTIAILTRKKVFYPWADIEKFYTQCSVRLPDIVYAKVKNKRVGQCITMHAYKGFLNRYLADELNVYLQKISVQKSSLSQD
jgi:hypothetical protein